MPLFCQPDPKKVMVLSATTARQIKRHVRDIHGTGTIPAQFVLGSREQPARVPGLHRMRHEQKKRHCADAAADSANRVGRAIGADRGAG
jgi:hypothetical protein